MLAVGAYLQTLRKKQGRHQKDVAKAAGVASKTVERWEAGGNEPALTTLEPAVSYLQGLMFDVIGLLTTEGAGVEEGRAAAETWWKLTPELREQIRVVTRQLMALGSGDERAHALSILAQMRQAQNDDPEVYALIERVLQRAH